LASEAKAKDYSFKAKDWSFKAKDYSFKAKDWSFKAKDTISWPRGSSRPRPRGLHLCHKVGPSAIP